MGFNIGLLLHVVLSYFLLVILDIESSGSHGFFANAFVIPTATPPRFSQLACKSTKPDRSPTTSNSSVGRLKFCYNRLQIQCPDEDYLRETPSLVIAAELKGVLSELAAEDGKTKLLPEKAFIAVLDAYMVAYRDVRKNKGNREQRTTNEYSKGMDAVVEGMQSTLSILHQHDQLHAENNNNKDEAFRSVDPYATLLHMLLELTLDDAQRSVHWATKSMEILVSLESNPRVDHQTKARLLQYNKVLKGLASSRETIGDAVYLLEKMCKSPKDHNSAEASPLQRAMDGLGPCLGPDAKSFATVLTSQHMDNQNTILRLVQASRLLGMYEGYLKGQLKKCFGDTSLSKLLGE